MAREPRGGLFGTGAAVAPLQQATLRPAGVPGSTYVRPQEHQTGTNLRALADALGGLNAALGNYASVRRIEEKDPNSDENRAFLDSIQGKSVDELREIARTGGHNRIQRDGLTSLIGSKAAQEFRLDVSERYNTEFDQHTGDFTSWAEQQRQEYAKGLPDEASRAAFFRGTEDWLNRFAGEDVNRKVQNLTTERDSAVLDEFRMTVEDAKAKGTDAKKVASEIMRQSAANRDFRSMDGRSQNAVIFALAQEAALAGDKDLVEALLNDDRGGVGPLIRTAEYATKGLKLIDDADGVARGRSAEKSFDVRRQIDDKVMAGSLTDKDIREYQKSNPWITDAVASNFVEQSNRVRQSALAAKAKEDARRAQAAQSEEERHRVLGSAYALAESVGGLYKLKDVEITGPTGAPVTVTAKQQLDAVVERKLQEFNELEGKATPEQIMRAKLSWFSGNGIMNPEWEKPLNDVSVLASIDRLRNGKEPSKQFAGYAETYRQLRAANPAYAARLVHDERSKEFLDTYADAVEDGASSEDGLVSATQIANQSPTQKAAAQLTLNQAREYAQDFFSAESGYEDTPANVAWFKSTVEKHMRRGKSEKLAIAAAYNELETTVNINGVVVPDHRDMPKDFEPLVNELLEDHFLLNGEKDGVESAEDYFIEPVGDSGSGKWIILKKVDGLPSSSDGQPTVIDAKRLAKYREAAEIEDRGQRYNTQQKARLRESARRNGMTPLKDGLWGSIKDALKGAQQKLYRPRYDPDGGPVQWEPAEPSNR